MENEFLASGGEWQEFLIGDIFNINTPKKKFDANKITFGGDYPYVARGDKNNGIRGYITEDVKYLNSGNTISFGQDTATMFYQENAYFTGDKIKVFALKNGKLNKLNSQFLISAMKKSFTLFSWGSSSFSEENLKQAKIQLPILNNKLAFEYMESYVRELQSERLRELQLYLKITGLSSYELTNDEINVVGGGNDRDWQLFNIVDIFDVKNTHSILSSWVVQNSGNIPYVTASESNNAISTYIDYDVEQIEKGNSIMIGGKTLIITYQEKDYFSNDSHNLALYLKNMDNPTKYIQLFFVSCLYKNLKPLYSWGNSISKKKITNDTVLLPINKNNQIDFDYMETYIKAIQKLIIKDLVLYTERELKAYEQVIG